MQTSTPGIATPLTTLFASALPAEDGWQVQPGLVVTRPNGDEWSCDVLVVELPLADVLADSGVLAAPWADAKEACDTLGGKMPLLVVHDPATDSWWAFSDTDAVEAPLRLTATWPTWWARGRKPGTLHGWPLTADVVQQLAWV